MSGICGICEQGRVLTPMALTAMLDALALSDESQREVHAGSSIAVGVARRWAFQQTASIENITVAVDADLVNFDDPAQVLSISTSAAARSSIAELFARLYLRRGVDFVKDFDGGFS